MSKPAIKTDAWMPLWMGAYLADTPHLSRAEHGGYLLLIMAYWRSQAPLPDDDRRLAAIAKASAREWRALRPVLAEFFDCRDGLWRHKRIDHELERAGKNIEARSAAGKASAARRAEQRMQQQGGNKSATSAEVLLQQNGRTTPTPPPTPEKPVGRGSAPHAAQSEAATLAIALRKQGVNITPANPYLLRWLGDGYTPEQIQDALEIARASKPLPAPMPAKYLDTVLRSPPTRPTRKRSLRHERAETIAALTGADVRAARVVPFANSGPLATTEPSESTARRVG